MKKWFVWILSFSPVFPLISCAEEPLGPYEHGAADDSVSSNPAKVDQRFANDLITAGLKEVEVSEMAVQRAVAPAVEEFAQMMIRDHRRANQELQRAAAELDVRLVPRLDEIRQTRQELIDLHGDAFDRAYMTLMVRDHQQAVRAVEQKVKGSGRAPIQTWASNMLTILREHLNRAQDVQGALAR